MLDADAAPIIGTFLLGKRRVLAVRYNGQKYVRLLGRAKQDLRHRHPRLWELIDKQPLDIDSNALCAHQNGMAACGGYWRGDGQQQVGIVGFGGNRREFEQVLALGMLVGELALNFREESTQGGTAVQGQLAELVAMMRLLLREELSPPPQTPARLAAPSAPLATPLLFVPPWPPPETWGPSFPSPGRPWPPAVFRHPSKILVTKQIPATESRAAGRSTLEEAYLATLAEDPLDAQAAAATA